MHKPNKLLEADVLDQLAWDPMIDATRVVVSANNGQVTLTGSVPTFFEVSRAGDDAQRVSGVTVIDNQLLVGWLGDAITDRDLAVAAATAASSRRSSGTPSSTTR